ncbi:type I-F CRISPR-associated protein Csy3 [Acinetobacter qingfengensis]|uniref:Type I-F CRISPR-associated protein Csy3 n=1 Tax=Acinetobacter qingfengensis TaxID=1262585 RepID=A0A1E7R1D3_9GAMM|nr:type I-F CRISPR-associated protein Csy3 [Acinetobacter qingfengensis]KAA8733232.1 type I-F CRISPR-associated protein Csy3 [Acinetobacter qingfengensis]OEY93135.1 type I-F CRISPR-associated protein Csy3 [Acinetobacter qingfengensis]
MAKEPKIKTASVLSFNRHLDPSDGRMTAVNWNDIQHGAGTTVIQIQEKSVRGTISNRPKNAKEAADAAAINAAVEKANLQTVDIAALPQGKDTVAVTFTLRVLPNVGQPSACNDESFAQRLDAVVSSYKSATQFQELAQRYAVNLANGRFLWRNRIGAENVNVSIERIINGKPTEKLSFDALVNRLNEITVHQEQEKSLEQLAQWIQAGLNGNEHVLLSITGFARLGEGQEVYPSQELILDTGNTKGKKSKTLYAIKDKEAGIHSQKIGNALRTIDTWYPDATKPIAVEPYGSVTSEGKAYRQPKENQDFYTLFDGWVNTGKTPEIEQQHYVMAVLVRGGVFGESDK